MNFLALSGGFADASFWEAGGNCSVRTKHWIPMGGHWWPATGADNQRASEGRGLASLKQETNFRCAVLPAASDGNGPCVEEKCGPKKKVTLHLR